MSNVETSYDFDINNLFSSSTFPDTFIPYRYEYIYT